MVLHVTFSDGSNPWISLPTDHKTVKKRWNQWKKYRPETAQPVAYCGGWKCEAAGDGSGYWVWENGNFFKTSKFYKKLGNALRALTQHGSFLDRKGI